MDEMMETLFVVSLLLMLLWLFVCVCIYLIGISMGVRLVVIYAQRFLKICWHSVTHADPSVGPEVTQRVDAAHMHGKPSAPRCQLPSVLHLPP